LKIPGTTLFVVETNRLVNSGTPRDLALSGNGRVGHTFQVIKRDGSPGPRKDTIIVLPVQKVSTNLIADNPGIWMLHCHNTHHQEAEW
jgi:hypothetical protein